MKVDMTKYFKKPEVNMGPPDELISKTDVLMYILDVQMGTDPHSEKGQGEYQVLSWVFDFVKEQTGIPINQRIEETENENQIR